MTRYITVTLTVPQANRILDSLHAHFAGDPGEGDLSWTQTECNSARAAVAIIQAALAGEPAEAFARGRQIVKGEA